MIACHETSQPACYQATIESTAAPGAQSVWVGVNLAPPEVEPRAVEILTVLNDVFDSFGSQSESGVHSAVWAG